MHLFIQLVDADPFAFVIFVEPSVEVCLSFKGPEAGSSTTREIRCDSRVINDIGQLTITMLHSIDECAIEDLTAVSPEIEARMVPEEERVVFVLVSCSLALDCCERAEQIRHRAFLVNYF